MKGISKSLFVAMALTFSCILTHAESPKSYSPCEHRAAVTTARLLLKPQSNRPRTPSNSYILCHYDGSIIWFSIPSGNDHLEITILDEETATKFEYTITVDSSISIGTNVDNLLIQCRTSNNQLYEGKIKTDNNQQ